MLRLDLDELLGKLDSAIPMRRRGLEQEGLLEDDLVAGILGERLRVKVRRHCSVMVAAGQAAGEIVAEQRARIGVLGRVGDHLGVGGGSDKNCHNEQRPLSPIAQGGLVHDRHIVSARAAPKPGL